MRGFSPPFTAISHWGGTDIMAARTLLEKECRFLGDFSAGYRSIIDAEAERLRSAIAKSAYFKAQRRGFAPGLEMSDWLDAEREVRQRVNRHG